MAMSPMEVASAFGSMVLGFKNAETQRKLAESQLQTQQLERQQMELDRQLKQLQFQTMTERAPLAQQEFVEGIAQERWKRDRERIEGPALFDEKIKNYQTDTLYKDEANKRGKELHEYQLIDTQLAALAKGLAENDPRLNLLDPTTKARVVKIREEQYQLALKELDTRRVEAQAKAEHAKSLLSSQRGSSYRGNPLYGVTNAQLELLEQTTDPETRNKVAKTAAALLLQTMTTQKPDPFNPGSFVTITPPITRDDMARLLEDQATARQIHQALRQGPSDDTQQEQESPGIVRRLFELLSPKKPQSTPATRPATANVTMSGKSIGDRMAGRFTKQGKTQAVADVTKGGTSSESVKVAPLKWEDEQVARERLEATIKANPPAMFNAKERPVLEAAYAAIVKSETPLETFESILDSKSGLGDVAKQALLDAAKTLHAVRTGDFTALGPNAERRIKSALEGKRAFLWDEIKNNPLIATGTGYVPPFYEIEKQYSKPFVGGGGSEYHRRKLLKDIDLYLLGIDKE